MGYATKGPFVNGGAPGIDASFLNEVETALGELANAIASPAAADGIAAYPTGPSYTYVSSAGGWPVTGTLFTVHATDVRSFQVLTEWNGGRSYYRAYHSGSGGWQAWRQIVDTSMGTSTGTANAWVVRDAAGRARFADPANNQDAATKGYVDAARTRIEAKNSPGAAAQETVTWTTAFTTVPVVTADADLDSTITNSGLLLLSRSTTGATGWSYRNGGASARVKNFLAMEAT